MKNRSNSIQALRFLACLCIFSHHCYITDNVFWGVSVFFVLSGFMMTQSYFNRDALSQSPKAALAFSIKKIGKLYPLHILTMLPVLALALYLRDPAQTALSDIAIQVTENVLLLQAWSSENAVTLNGVAWYLSACLFLYFMFPYILACLRTYRSRKTAVIAIVILYALEFVFAALAQPLGRAIYGGADITKFTAWYGYIFPLFRVFDFAIGCNLGYIFLTRREGEGESRRACAALEIACAALYIAAVYLMNGDTFLSRAEFSYGVIHLPFAAALVYLFAVGKGLVPRLLTNRVTVFLGDISAYFFLIHQDVVRIGYMGLDRLGLTAEESRPYLFIGCGLISIGLSVMYRALESAVKAKRKARLG